MDIIRRTWKSTRIIIRADSGFCRDDLLDWCETNKGIDYVIGLARNKRLEAELAPFQAHAKDIYKLTKERAKLFTSFTYRTMKSWSRARRVIGKAEQIPGKANPRFVVTSLACEGSREATRLYTEVYCARGDMENRIKEQQNYMFADRLSAHEMRANQVRVYLSGIAYILLHGVRRLALQGTDMAKAQCHTIREKLLRIGARVKVTARRIWVHMSEACPMKDAYLRAMARLSILPEWSPPG